MGQQIGTYIDSVGNNLKVTDLDKCLFAVNSNAGPNYVVRRSLHDVLKRRNNTNGDNGTGTNTKTTSTVLTSVVITQSASTLSTIPSSDGNSNEDNPPFGGNAQTGERESNTNTNSEDDNRSDGSSQNAEPPSIDRDVFESQGQSIAFDQNAQSKSQKADGAIVVADQTIPPGQATIVNGIQVSVPSSGGNLIVGGSSTIDLGSGENSEVLNIGGSYVTVAPVAPTAILAITTTPTTITINGQTYTPIISNGQTKYVIAPGTTLTPGGVITVSGTRISMDSNGTALVFGSITSTISNMPKSTSIHTTISSSTTPGNTVSTITTDGLKVTHKAVAGRIMRNETMGLLICVAGFLVEIFGIIF